MRTRGADVGGGCLEEVTPSFKNEKDSGQRRWGRGCLEPKPAGRQDNSGRGGAACPPHRVRLTHSCCFRTHWLSGPHPYTAEVTPLSQSLSQSPHIYTHSWGTGRPT